MFASASEQSPGDFLDRLNGLICLKNVARNEQKKTKHRQPFSCQGNIVSKCFYTLHDFNRAECCFLFRFSFFFLLLFYISLFWIGAKREKGSLCKIQTICLQFNVINSEFKELYVCHHTLCCATAIHFFCRLHCLFAVRLAFSVFVVVTLFLRHHFYKKLSCDFPIHRILLWHEVEIVSYTLKMFRHSFLSVISSAFSAFIHWYKL